VKIVKISLQLGERFCGRSDWCRYLWLTSQDTSPLLNKVVRAPSNILIGQTRSETSSHGLPQYLMIHSPFCSIYVT
jgi:hypothetical protein